MTAALWESLDESAGPDAALVVLVHGSMDRARSFAKVQRDLRDLRTLAYDRRGYGRSRHLGGPFDVPTQVGDLFAVLAGRRAVVVGHSFGGLVALAAAEARPDLVRAVGAFETPLPWRPGWPPDTPGAVAVAEAATLGVDVAMERFARHVLGDATWEGLGDTFRAERLADGPALVGEVGASRLAPAFDPARIAVPVVAGRGEGHAPHHRWTAEELARIVPGTVLSVLAGAGHDAHRTHPEAFAAFVRKVVARAC